MIVKRENVLSFREKGILEAMTK
jgi:hypothetical protein